MASELSKSLYPARISLAMIAIAFAAGFLLCGYEFIRSASSSIYIDLYGSGKLPYAMFGGAVFTIIFLYGYGLILTWLGPRRTLLITSLFSCCIIALCYLALRNGSRIASGILYAFREAYIVVVIEEYWSFINSTLRERQAKVFNGPITGMGSLGAIAGGLAVGFLAERIGTESMLLLASASLIPAAFCSEVAYRLGGEPTPPKREKDEKKSLALSLFVDSSYLRRIGLLIFLTQVVSTTLDLRFSGLVEQSLPVKDARTAYFGMFYARLNIVAGVLQFAIAPLLLSFVKLRFLHPAIPIIHIASATVLIAKPTLFTGGFAYLLFKAFDYSIFRASKEIFYIPLSFDSRYRAKEVIDAFGYRASKGLSAGLASVAAMIFGVLPGFAYPSAAIASAFGWFVLVKKLVHQHDDILKQYRIQSESQKEMVA